MSAGNLRCCVCGSAEWISCAPGTEAEDRVQGNVCVLHPAPEVPLRAWCWTHAMAGGQARPVLVQRGTVAP